MTISACCGAPIDGLDGARDTGLCPDCHEPCQWEEATILHHASPSGGLARRRTIKHVLNIVQILLFPICIAIAPGPASKMCVTIATMMFMSRLYIGTLKAPNTEVSDGRGARSLH